MKLKLIILLSSLLALGSQLSAVIILDVDAVNETLTFTGSSSLGTPLNFSGGFVQWQLNNIPGTVRGSGSVPSSERPLMLSSSASTVKTSFDFVYQTGSTGGAPGTGGLGVVVGLTSANPTIISGTGTTYSYAGWDADSKNLIETAANQGLFLPLGTGTGFGDISVVPEPSTYAAILSALIFSFVLHRRRKAKAA